MVSEDRLTEFLRKAYHEYGYAVGTKRIPGFIPGAKTFPEFRNATAEGWLSYVDVYFGKRESGGVGVVSFDDSPILLIQFRGGETPRVPDEEVSQINDFLKQALRSCISVRLPGNTLSKYQGNQYGYVGMARGGIWDLRWVELIYRLDGRHDIRYLTEGPRADEYFSRLMVQGLNRNGQDWLVFYHVLTHQRIR